MNDKVFETKGLTKVYKDGAGNELNILEGIDSTFHATETISIVGASGTGKSTFLNLLSGLDQPSSGEVLFQDENIFRFSSKKLADWRSEHIGFIFQFHHLLPDFNALENVMIPSLISGASKAKAKEKAASLLDQVGLSERLTHKPAELSGGEQQRVAIARALINEPSVILADEPTGNLDEETAVKIGKLLVDICKTFSTTLILVTHNSHFAQQMEHRYLLSNHHLLPH